MQRWCEETDGRWNHWWGSWYWTNEQQRRESAGARDRIKDVEDDIDDRLPPIASTTRPRVIVIDASSDEVSYQNQSDVFAWDVQGKAGTFTVGTETRILYECDATAGAMTANLQGVASLNGYEYIFKKIDVSPNAVTVDGSGAEQIDGALTRVLAMPGDAMHIVGGTGQWRIV